MFDKITSRIQKLCYGLNMDFVDPVSKYSVYQGFFARYVILCHLPLALHLTILQC